MKAKVKWVEGLEFIGESESGHTVKMDGDVSFGGKNSGMRPTEILLVALAGCTGMDVISLLQKKRQQVSSMEIKINGLRSEEHPKKFTNIELEYIIVGKDISEEAVKRCIELSMDKYCSVKATLEGGARITSNYKIVAE